MRRFSRRPSDGAPDDESGLVENDGTLEDELLGELGLVPPVAAAVAGNNGGGQRARWQRAVRELLALLAAIKGKIRTEREGSFYEMGLRSAHIQQALKVNEPDRARSHAQAVARAAARVGHTFTEPPTLAVLKGLAMNQRERDVFALGFAASLFEEAVATMRLADAERLTNQIVDLVESL
mgnify:CR=1 FL=1